MARYNVYGVAHMRVEQVVRDADSPERAKEIVLEGLGGDVESSDLYVAEEDE